MSSSEMGLTMDQLAVFRRDGALEALHGAVTMASAKKLEVRPRTAGRKVVVTTMLVLPEVIFFGGVMSSSGLRVEARPRLLQVPGGCLTEQRRGERILEVAVVAAAVSLSRLRSLSVRGSRQSQ
jgi:hypothetical protein